MITKNPPPENEDVSWADYFDSLVHEAWQDLHQSGLSEKKPVRLQKIEMLPGGSAAQQAPVTGPRV